MKKAKKISGFILIFLLSIMFVMPVMAKEEFTANIVEAVKSEDGDSITIDYDNANCEDIIVTFYNEENCKVYEFEYTSTVKGRIELKLETGPIMKFYIKITNGNSEITLPGEYIFKHEHIGEYVKFVRPTETMPGRMYYFKCSCGKNFEDKECTKEITENIDEWSYIPPTPKKEGDPVPYVERYDGKCVTDPNKPNPTWSEEDVKEYYDQEENTQEVEQTFQEVEQTSQEVEQTADKSQLFIESEEVVAEPVAFCTEPAKEEATIWEKIKEFFKKIIRGE